MAIQQMKPAAQLAANVTSVNPVSAATNAISSIASIALPPAVSRLTGTTIPSTALAGAVMGSSSPLNAAVAALAADGLSKMIFPRSAKDSKQGLGEFIGAMAAKAALDAMTQSPEEQQAAKQKAAEAEAKKKEEEAIALAKREHDKAVAAMAKAASEEQDADKQLARNKNMERYFNQRNIIIAPDGTPIV